MSFSPYIRGGKFINAYRDHLVEGPADIPVVRAWGALHLARFLITHEDVVTYYFPDTVVDSFPGLEDDHTMVEMKLPDETTLVMQANSIGAVGVSMAQKHKSKSFHSYDIDAHSDELAIRFANGSRGVNMTFGRGIQPITVGTLWNTADHIGTTLQWVHDEIVLGRGLPNEA